MKMKQTRQSSQALARCISLSDAIFSVVITISVFQIIPNDLILQLQLHGAAAEIETLAPQIFYLVVIFLITAMYWMGHQRIFSHIVGADPRLLLFILFFLMSITFFPFTTELLSAPNEDKTAAVLWPKFGDQRILTSCNWHLQFEKPGTDGFSGWLSRRIHRLLA